MISLRISLTNAFSFTSAKYLTSVIARDRPDILDRMKKGEFKSVRAAGIVKVPTVLDQLKKLWTKTTPSDKG